MKTPQRVAVGAIVAVLIAVTSVLFIFGRAASPVDVNGGLGSQALENLSPFEQSVLKDRYVTEAEFDESTHAYTECLAAAGLNYEMTPGQVGIGSVLVRQTGPPGPDSDDAFQRCVDQVNAVQNVWILQNPDNAAGAKPLPGLAEALAALDTSGW
jgi:hypothetical protein